MNNTTSKTSESKSGRPRPGTASIGQPGLVFSLIVLAGLLLFGFILYGNSLDSEFHLDDYPNLVENPALHMTTLDWSSLKSATMTMVGGNRPISSLLFAVNFYFSQFNVRGFHITSVLVHVLAGWVLFLLLFETMGIPSIKRSIGVDIRLAALLATLVWFAHPVQTQAVTYIVQRSNALAALFYFLAMYLFARLRLRTLTRRSRALHWSLLILSGLLALGSKETSATLPVAILLYEFMFIRELDLSGVKGKAWFVAGIIAAPILIVAADSWRFGMSFFARMGDVFQLRGFTMWERVLTEFRVLVHYITLLLAPLPSRLNLEHDVTLSRSLFDPFTTLLSLILLAALLVLGFYLVRRRPLISFAIFWFFMQLAIESSIIPLELMFEHRLYLPSVALGLIVVSLLFHRPDPAQRGSAAPAPSGGSAPSDRSVKEV